MKNLFLSLFNIVMSSEKTTLFCFSQYSAGNYIRTFVILRVNPTLEYNNRFSFNQRNHQLGVLSFE